MAMNPVDDKPTGTFADAINKEPTIVRGVAGVVPNVWELWDNQTRLGWLGVNSTGYAVLVTSLADAVNLELYPYDAVNYYRTYYSGAWHYLSVSKNAYVGFWLWGGATGWTREGERMKSDYDGQYLSIYSTDNQYLYAWNAYTILDVKLGSK
jgi:hypothetical protein